VILVDANILIYATNRDAERHDIARHWLDDRLSGTASVGLPWPSLLAFLRLTTNPRLFERPLSMAVAWKQIAAWLDAEPSWVPQPTERHTEFLAPLLDQPGIQGNLMPDAHLAALAIEHGLTLCSTDSDFARFKGLNWIDPLG
jgi:toxin-antitoxin system PIN domain toxin